MKKSKIILAIVLATVLVITCAGVPTFSWFDRPQTQTGEEIVLQTDNEYNAYNGKSVSISTTTSSTGIEDSYTTSANNAGDCSGSGIMSTRRKYFCTTITNASGKEQNVSLYARTLTIPTAVSTGNNNETESNGTLAIGVNSPTRSYHDYSSRTNRLYNTVENYDKRVYFQTYGVPGWESGQDIYINFGYEYGNKSFKMNYIKYDNTYGHIYYSDIPYSANQLYFTVSGWEKADQGNADNTLKSVTATNLPNSKDSILTSSLFRIKNQKESNTNYRPFDANNQSINGASIKQYYHDITVKTGATFNASQELIKQASASVKYYSSNEAVFTVNETTGVITGVAAGTATLYTKVIGATYGDYIQKETSVTVTSDDSYVFNDIPIVKNIKIPAENSSTDELEGEVKVYWYVINNSKEHALTYTIDNIYLSL